MSAAAGERLSGLKILWIFEVDSSLRMTWIADAFPEERNHVKVWCHGR
jgi:hypothetical protein